MTHPTAIEGTAMDQHTVFLALVRAGFSEHQAIELLGPWVCIDGRGAANTGVGVSEL